MSRRRKPGKTLDVVQRLQQRVAEGDYYEALQLYKTSYSRYKAQGKLDDAEELLVAGAIAMSQEKELNAATELGMLILTSFEEHGRECDATRLEMLKRVAESMSPGMEMFEFLKRAVRWAKKSQEPGAYELRLILARSMLATGRLGDAARYLAIAGRPDEYASLVKQWAEKGYRGEMDLFVCRAVLHTLSCRRTEDAEELQNVATSLLEESGNGDARNGGVLDSPLCHFTNFVVELCQAADKAGSASSEMVTTFRALRKAYEPSLNRDPNFDDILNRIGHVYFGIKPPQSEGFMGMLEQLVGGM